MRKHEKLQALAEVRGYKYHSGKLYEEIMVSDPLEGERPKLVRLRDDRINEELIEYGIVGFEQE